MISVMPSGSRIIARACEATNQPYVAITTRSTGVAKTPQPLNWTTREVFIPDKGRSGASRTHFVAPAALLQVTIDHRKASFVALKQRRWKESWSSANSVFLDSSRQHISAFGTEDVLTILVTLALRQVSKDAVKLRNLL